MELREKPKITHDALVLSAEYMKCFVLGSYFKMLITALCICDNINEVVLIFEYIQIYIRRLSAITYILCDHIHIMRFRN